MDILKTYLLCLGLYSIIYFVAKFIYIFYINNYIKNHSYNYPNDNNEEHTLFSFIISKLYYFLALCGIIIWIAFFPCSILFAISDLLYEYKVVRPMSEQRQKSLCELIDLEFMSYEDRKIYFDKDFSNYQKYTYLSEDNYLCWKDKLEKNLNVIYPKFHSPVLLKLHGMIYKKMFYRQDDDNELD